MKNETFSDILIRLGPTILGVKPAELLNIRINGDLDKCKKCINNYPQINYLQIKKLEKVPRMQVLFFHKNTLEKTLTEKVNKDFLIGLGYPRIFTRESYLNILKERLNSEQFPHEIGVFLGYPLKDVLGYMGKYPWKLVRIKGWRYYGSEKLSRLYYEKFKKSKEDFRSFISGLDSPEDFYDFIKSD